MSLEKVLKYWLACSSGLLCRVLRGPIITPLLSKPLNNTKAQYKNGTDVRSKNPARGKRQTSNVTNRNSILIDRTLSLELLNAFKCIHSTLSPGLITYSENYFMLYQQCIQIQKELPVHSAIIAFFQPQEAYTLYKPNVAAPCLIKTTHLKS